MFEKEIRIKFEPQMNGSLELNRLRSAINTLVYEKQQNIRNEFDYKRKMLIFDATDHHLVRTFFNLKLNKSQVR